MASGHIYVVVVISTKTHHSEAAAAWTVTFPYLKLESLEIKFGPSGISCLLWRISFS